MRENKGLSFFKFVEETLLEEGKTVLDEGTLIALMMGVAHIYEKRTAPRTRKVLQNQTEVNQFEVKVSTDISEYASIIRKLTEELLTYESVFNSIKCGQDIGVQYQDDQGNYKELEQETKIEQRSD